MFNQQFANRTCVIATMHHKETTIAPILMSALGVEIQVPANFDTDRFGTFTRDRGRPGNQRETAQKKVQAALALTGETLGIASEGSFFPHPAFPMLPCNREIVLLEDLLYPLTLWGESLSLETNFYSQSVQNWQEVEAFAKKIGFPDHGIVIMPDPHAQTGIYKGIRDWDTLTKVVQQTTNHFGKFHIETDMRALHNPTRLRNIARATEDLVRKLQSTCPSCHTAGFDVIKRLEGLPCSWCGLPTTQVRAVIRGCMACPFTQEQPFPEEKTTADPAFCSFCNP